MSSNNQILDNKYNVIEKKGHGATANVYLVKDINSENQYAAKVLKKESKYFEKEASMLKLLADSHIPYIVNLIASGKGPMVKNSIASEDRQYLILEYAEKGELFDYIYLPKKGLGEKYGKVVFAKILKGIKACHDAGVCHRDLKMENILLDKNFNPKIADFGFATLIKGQDGNNLLSSALGTLNYAAPEILLKKKYEGIKADTFSLGVVLLTLVTCKVGFLEATRRDPYYRYIMSKHYNQYWDRVKGQITGVSEDFKNLFIKMISFDPKERPSIDDILFKDPWMEEIRNLNESQLKELEAEIYQDFVNREEIVKEKQSENENASQSNENLSSGDGYRGLNGNEKEYFNLDLRPKYARKTGLNMTNFIKIDGNLQPSQFMNALANKIFGENEDTCFIEESKKTLKFDITFLEKEKEEEEISEDMAEELKKLGIDEDEEIEMEKENSRIKVKLLESPNGGYIIRFDKQNGEKSDFYKNLEKIKKAIKEII